MDDKTKSGVSGGIADKASQQGNEERKIYSAPIVHTGEGGGIHIPDSETDEINLDADARRFIKSSNTPFVSPTAKKIQTEAPTDISRFTDRLTPRVPEKKESTGYTGKINVYPENHAAAEKDSRMISGEGIAEEKTGTPDSTYGQIKFSSVVISRESKADLSETKEVVFNSKKTEQENVSSDAVSPSTKEIKYSSLPKENSTADNSPTKHIDNKSGLLREIAGTADDDMRLNPDQLMMDGFEEENKENDDENEIEAALHETRQKRINSFNFWGKKHSDDAPENTDESYSTDSEHRLPEFLQKIADRFANVDSSFVRVGSSEYTDFNNRKSIFSSLINARKTVLIKTFAIAFLGIILFIIDLAASISAAANNGFFTLFGGSYNIYNAVNIVFLLISAVFLATDLKNGIISMFKIRPKADSFLTFMFVLVLAQNIASFFTQLKIEENYHLFTPTFILLCVPYLLAQLFYCDNVRQCFKAVAVKSEKAYLRKVSDEALSAELLREKNTDGENLVYSGKTKFIKSFIARSANSAFAGMPSSRLVLLCMAVSVVAGVAAAIINRSPVYGLSAAALTAVLSFPISCVTATGFNLSRENKKLSIKSSFVQSYSDARDFASVDNLVLDTVDIFEAKTGTVMAAKNVREDQALFCAGVLCSKAGGVLSEAFAGGIAGYENKIPAVDSLVYEDKLGLSAWISGCKVLLGTHALLVNHNVSVPDEKIVARMLAENEKPVFLAIEGNFAALFGVKYSCKTSAYNNLKQLVSGGTNLLFSTTDANITDIFAEQMLGLPSGSVRIITQKAVSMFNNAKAAVPDEEEAGIVFTDSIESLCRCAGAAVTLDRSKTLTKAVCSAGSAIGLLLALALVFTGVYTKTSSIIPVLIQLIWLAVCFVSPALFTELKPKKNKKRISILNKKAPNDEDYDEDYDDETEDGNSTQDLDKNTQAVKRNARDNGNAKADANENTVKETYTENVAPSGVGSQKADAKTEYTVNVKAAENAADDYKKDDYISSLPSPDDINPRRISTETINVLDALANTPAPKPVKTQAEQNDDDDDFDVQKAEKSAGGFFGRLKKNLGLFSSDDSEDEADSADTPNSDDEDESALHSKSKNKRRSYSKTNSAEQNTAEQNVSTEEKAYSEQKAEEERTRQLFTPPEMPSPPHYDLNKRPVEPKVTEKRVPTTPTVFTDSMFKAFTNDDDVFAGLRESPPEKYDF